LDGQFAGQPLISNEQYLAGGASSVRGYLESEVAGDRALHTTLELRTPPLFRSLSMVQDLRFLAFYDAAKLRLSGDNGSTKPPFIAGAGFGIRLKAFKNLSADLDIAVPLHGGDATEKHDVRSHIRLSYEF
jgi:hemolysin activation/secretion protein